MDGRYQIVRKLGAGAAWPRCSSAGCTAWAASRRRGHQAHPPRASGGARQRPALPARGPGGCASATPTSCRCWMRGTRVALPGDGVRGCRGPGGHGRPAAHTHRRLSPAGVAWVGAQVCEALDFMFQLRDEQGGRMIEAHRDISSANVLVSRTGMVKLGDFGVVRLRQSKTGLSTVRGKWEYFPPEIVTDAADERATSSPWGSRSTSSRPGCTPSPPPPGPCASSGRGRWPPSPSSTCPPRCGRSSSRRWRRIRAALPAGAGLRRRARGLPVHLPRAHVAAAAGGAALLGRGAGDGLDSEHAGLAERLGAPGAGVGPGGRAGDAGDGARGAAQVRGDFRAQPLARRARGRARQAGSAEAGGRAGAGDGAGDARRRRRPCLPTTPTTTTSTAGSWPCARPTTSRARP